MGNRLIYTVPIKSFSLSYIWNIYTLFIRHLYKYFLFKKTGNCQMTLVHYNCTFPLLNSILTIVLYVQSYPQRHGTSETNVRNLFSPFSCIQVPYRPKQGYFCAQSFSKSSKYSINCRTKNQALNCYICRVVFTEVSFFG